MLWGRDKIVIMALVTMAVGFGIAAGARAEAGLNADQLVELAIEANPQIHSMRAQWEAANHQILQNYAPAEILFSPSPMLMRRHGLFDHAATHSHQLSDNFQFPGKAQLPRRKSQRGTAKIARFAYEAAIRDLRAAD